ncbi:hypothetical protein BC936DRAFT_140146 [Jimgerdemannia flammicorona]|uniref:Uncharacterized protein n=1 Tax=Jimgerdemannia flammicorona TaxID=994334 RepID=A0A433AZ72_9FUNG|nr:hypothetical protein BC936DRAFT_140146 [Jimgerdemannia flammicorona]
MQTITVLEQYAENEPVISSLEQTTFETICRIGFEYDFHLLDSCDAPRHPFIQAMAFCLAVSTQRNLQAQFIKHLPIKANRRFERERKRMQDIVDEVIRARELSPDSKNSEKDLLGYMLNAVSEEGLDFEFKYVDDTPATYDPKSQPFAHLTST